MKSASSKIAFFVFILTLPLLMMGRTIWSPEPLGITPTPAQLTQLMILSSIESIAFALGILFMIFAWKYFRMYQAQLGRLSTVTYISLGWIMISWWPHDNFHEHIGTDLQKLIYVEYAFHVTSVFAAFCICLFFLKLGASLQRVEKA